MSVNYRLPSENRWQTIVIAAMAVVLLGLGTHLFVRQDNEWEKVFITAAARLWSGGDVYQAGGAYLYPPFTAWLTLPFLALSHGAGRLVFVILNLACLMYVLRGAWRLAGGGGLENAAQRWAALAGASCGIFFMHNCLVHQQTDLFIAALLMGGCLALNRDRALTAATGFGLAAAMKCTPLLWAPYLVWRRRPVAAAWLLAVALGVNLLPDLVRHPESGGTWLGVFVTRHLAPLTDHRYVPGSWGSEIVYNQSLAGAAQRWLRTAPRWTAAECLVEETESAAPPAAIRGVLLSADLTMAVLAAIALGRPFRPIPDGNRAVFEYGVVFVLMLLLSPMSSMAHFGILILPGFCLARRALERRDVVARVLLALAIVASCASNKDLIGGRLYTTLLWVGCVMFNAIFLLAGCLRALLHARDERDMSLLALRSISTPTRWGDLHTPNDLEFTPAAADPLAASVSESPYTRASSSSA
jgi:hypothetical protein